MRRADRTAPRWAGTLLSAAFCFALGAGAPARAAQAPPDIWERIGSADADKDAKVSRQEFRGAPMMFERLDANQDGFITREEAEAFRRQMAPGGARLPDNDPRAGLRGPDVAPTVGAPIPQVRAKTPEGDKEVDLSSVRRTTVLIFGSFT